MRIPRYKNIDEEMYGELRWFAQVAACSYLLRQYNKWPWWKRVWRDTVDALYFPSNNPYNRD